MDGIDLSELSVAPWTASNDECPCVYNATSSYESPLFEPLNSTAADAAFCALARNAIDVMMRRGWGVRRCGNGWNLSGILGLLPEDIDFVEWCYEDGREWADPFTALVEADRRYGQQLEKANAGQKKEA